MTVHYHKINELETNRGRTRYWHYLRQFWHVYDKNEVSKFEAHLETLVKKQLDNTLLSIRLSVGNDGSETPWDGHFLLFGVGFFWGHSAFRKLASWITRCSGYKYDNRVWSLRISDGQLWWEFANHSDMCRKEGRSAFGLIKESLGVRSPSGGVRKRRRNTLKRGNVNLSIPEAIWGPKRYTYEDVDSFVTTIKMPEGEYAVVLRLQKVRFGRTKVDKRKHIQSWTIEVDAPKGVPTHHDASGGWKGDRTYGWGVHFDYPRSEGWQQDAEAAVTAWVLKERARTGFRKPQKVE